MASPRRVQNRQAFVYIREFLDDPASRRVNPLELVGGRPGKVRLWHKELDNGHTFKPAKSQKTVITPKVSEQLRVAAARCKTKGHDPSNRLLLLSHVPCYLNYYDGDDGSHDLYWLALTDPGYLGKLYRETVMQSTFPHTKPNEKISPLQAFKTLLMVRSGCYTFCNPYIRMICDATYPGGMIII